MKTNRAPALLPALGILLGTCLAAPAGAPRGACVLLVASGVALRRPAGIFVAAAALGALHATAVWVEPREALAELDLGRPVEVVATVNGHPRRSGDEVLAVVRTRHLVQGRRLLPVAIDVRLSLPTADDAPTLELGAVVRFKGFLRRSAGYANQEVVRPGPWRLKLKSRRLLEVEGTPGFVARRATWLRRGVEEVFDGARGEIHDDVAPGPGLALARALVLGDRGELPLAWVQVLRRLGLAHLLAVSGLHVALLAVALLAAAAPLPRLPRTLVALAGIGVYLLLVGPQPAMIRAAVMGAVALAALAAERPPQSLHALACGVLVLVLGDPSIVAELGFQLTVAATAGIVVLTPLLAERFTLVPAALRRPLAATCAAQLATLPFLLPVVSAWHPLAPAWNLLAVPWLAVFLLAAFAWVVVAAAVPSWGAATVPLLDAAAAPLVALESLPPTAFDLRLAILGPGTAVLVALVLLAAGLWPRRAAPFVLAAALLVLVGSAPPEVARSPSDPELVLVDVGQGDAVLLRDGRHAVLVDGGGWPAGDFGGRVLLPALAAAGVSRLDAVVLSHPDLDHCGGLADLVRYLPVAEVWAGHPEPGEEPDCARRLFAAPGPRHRLLEPGDALSAGRWRFTVLHPPAGARGAANDLSLVLSAEAAGHRVLLPGDLAAAGEARLLRQGAGLRADVLKVGHHGSRGSTSTAWLDAVAPRYALVSAGAGNPYGHPAPEVLVRLERRGARVLRTDLEGLVRLRFGPDGKIAVELPARRSDRVGR